MATTSNTAPSVVTLAQSAASVKAPATPTAFKVNVDPASVVGTHREGQDLVINLENGQKKRIQNYFANGVTFNEVEFTGAEAASAPGAPSLFGGLFSSGEESAGSLGGTAGLAALALGGVVAAAAGGGTKSSAGSSSSAAATGITANANGTVSVAGAATPGASVKVTYPDGTTSNAVAGTDGTYFATSTTPQTSGAVTVAIKEPNSATTNTSTTTFKDATAPHAPAAASTTSNANGTLTVAGAAEPGSTVKVTFPDGTSASVTADANGAYTATSAKPQPSGSVSVSATDAAGNTSPTATSTFTDMTAPLTPAGTTVTPNANGTLTAAGSAEPGSMVKVTFPDGTIASVTASAAGTYSATSAAPQTSGAVSVKAVDASGNASNAAIATFTDTAAPATPAATAITPNANGTLTVSGIAEPGSTVQVTFPDGTIANITAAANGTYAVTSTAPQTSGAVSIKATDAAGNASSAVNTTFADTTAPVTPASTITTNANGTLMVSGTAEPGSTVKVTFPDGTFASITAGPSGAYSATSSAPQTTGSISVKATDSAGNTSPATTTAFTDTKAPAAPTGTTVTPNADGTLSVAGFAEPGSTVKVTFPDGTIAIGIAGPTGSYNATSAAPQGTGQVKVAATDTAGNTSTAVGLPFVDTGAPAKPAITAAGNADGTVTVSGTAEPGSTVKVTFPDGTTASVITPNGVFALTSAASQPSGPVSVIAKDAAGNVSPAATNAFADTTAPTKPSMATTANADGTLTVSGNTEPGASVKVTFPDGTSANIIAGPSGTYSATSADSQPSGTVSVAVKDAAGNAAPVASTGFADTTAPIKPSLAAAANADGTLTASGTAEPGSTLKVTFPDGTTTTVTATAAGTYAASSTAPQPSGSVSAIAKDPAGNASPVASSAYADTTAPAKPTAGVAANADGTITVSGSAEPGSTIKITYPDGSTATATAGPAGTYAVTSPNNQPSGNVSVVAKDPAGNTSSAATSAYADSTPPGAPTLASASNADGTLTVSGTSEPGSVVKVTFPDGSTANAVAGANGLYSAMSAAAQPSGNVSVIAKDLGGNASPAASAAYVDVTPPAKPTLATAVNADGTVTVSGSAESGTVVKVTFADGTIANVTASAAGTYTVTSATNQPTGTISAIAKDTSGNASPIATTAFADASAPVQPTLAAAANADGTVTVSGTAEPGSTVKVTFPDGSVGTATAIPAGTYAITSATPQPSGPVLALAKDAVGNASPSASTSYADATAPTKPTLNQTANADGTLTVSGSAEPGASVKVTFPDGTTATIVASPTGAFAATSNGNQPSGTVSATAKDAAGNVSPAMTSAYADATAPSKPTLTTGANPDGTVTVSGNAEAGSAVTVTFPDGTTANVTANAAGAYAATSAANQPAGNATAIARDAAGNSSPTAVGTYADATAPSKPTLASAANADGTLTVSGLAEPGATVIVGYPDGTFGTVTAGPTGAYTATSPGIQPTGPVSVTAKDPAGNVSAPGKGMYADGTAPTAPTVALASNADGTVTASGFTEPGASVKVTFPDGTTTTVTAGANGIYMATSATIQPSGAVTAVAKDLAGNASPVGNGSYVDATAPAKLTLAPTANPDGTLTVTGVGEPGASVKVTFPDGTTKTVGAGPDGAYTVTSAGNQPSGTVNAVATDAAGNKSPTASAPYGDATAPNAPSLTATGNADGTLKVTGTAEAGALVKVTFPDGTTASVTAGPAGTYSATSLASQPSGPVSATAKDAAGNISPAANGTYADTIAPSAPTLTATPNTDGTITVAGFAEPNAIVKVTFPDGTIGIATASATGSYAATSAGNQPSGSVSVKATDAAGNVSPAASGTYADTIAPSKPTLNSATNADGTLTVSGLAEPNSTVAVTFPDGTKATVTTGANGAYAATSAAAQPSGSITSVATDAAGNHSTAATGTYSDVGAPPAPVIAHLADDVASVLGDIAAGSATNDAKPTLSGTAEAGATVKVYDGAALLGTALAGPTGAWSFSPSASLADGAHQLTVKAVDFSGNVSDPTSAVAFTVDTTAPVAPIVMADATAAGAGVFVGTAEAGSTVNVYLAGHTTPDFTTTADAGGNWSVTALSGVTIGSSVIAKATDLAGNASAASTATVGAAPTLDLNAVGPQLIANGATPGATGWTTVGGHTGNGGYVFDADSATGSLGQAGIVGWDRGSASSGAAQLTFNLGWNNRNPENSVAETMSVTIDGTEYARFTSGANSTTGTMSYYNGASGAVATIAASSYGSWTKTAVTIDLPANVSASGKLAMNWGSGAGGGDDIFVDDVSAIVPTGPNYTDTFTARGAPVLIANTLATKVTDADTANMASAKVVLTNKLTGDVLSIGGTAVADGATGIYNGLSYKVVDAGGAETITFTGSAAKVVYQAAIDSIAFSNTLSAPALTDRTIDVSVNDGLMDSNVAVATIHVVSSAFKAPATVTTTTAATSYAQAGYSVSRIGDFNGDGIDDFVVGAPASEAGHVTAKTSDQYIVYGNAAGVPNVSLDSINASQGIHITATTFKLPNSDYGQTGHTVTNLGDINGDGFADVGISSNYNDRAYVVMGRGGNATSAIELGSIDASNSGQATADGFAIVNWDTGAWMGSSMSGGDINGDGFGDIIVGSLDGGGNGGGQATVYYGHEGKGGTAAWENLYASPDGLHQINANAGYGARLNNTLASTVNTSESTAANYAIDSDLGARVAVIADVNGDGYNDYMVTAPRTDKNGVYDTGTAYLMFGGAKGLGQFDLANLTPSQGVKLTGSEVYEQLGGSYLGSNTTTQGVSALNSAGPQSNNIANIGDINGDGTADFAIGSPSWGNQQFVSSGPGRVYVVFGKDAGVNWAGLNLGALDGTNGFILHKPSAGASSNSNTSVNQLGWSVAGGVDMNGDGIDDMVVSAPGENVGGKDVGAVYIVYGKAGGTTAFPSLNDLDAMVTAGTAKKLTGAAANEYFGSSVTTGDFNGDGIGDVAIGAAGVATSAGATYVTYGQTNGFTQVGSTDSDELLSGATTAGLAAIVGGVDRIDGGKGNDVIHGIGAAADAGNAGLFDVAYGAAGNDTIGIEGMNFTRVDGGLGSDTLKVEGGAPLSIDLSQLATKVQGFETFDLAGTGSSLTVLANDVLHQKSVITSNFTVMGGATDHVVLTNAANAQWNATGATKTVGGITYDTYHSTGIDASNTNADVLIQQGVQVDLTPAAQVIQTTTATKSYAYSGQEVANIGDFNGDGIADYLVSAPANEYGREQVYGSKQFVVYGDKNGVPKVNLDAMTATQGIEITTTNMKFGSIDIGTTGNTVAALGDLNGDGFADFAMSSNRGDSAFVVFGRGGDTTQSIDLATVSASGNGNATADGFYIGNTSTGGWFGTGLAGGDINGDGYGDLIVGASDGGGNGNGQYMTLYGHAGAGGTASWQNLYAAYDGLHTVGSFATLGTLLATTASQSVSTTDYTTVNYTADADLGDRIAVVGDVNGDGFNDYIVTAPRVDHNGVNDTGTAYLMFGSKTGLGNYDLKNLTAAQGVNLYGSEVGELLGGTTLATASLGGIVSQGNVAYGQSHSVADIGDINGDGIDDVAIGSPGWGNQNYYNSGAGRTYIVYGQQKGVTWSDASLGSLSGTSGFVLSKSSAGTSSGSNTNNNQLGWSIAGGGDFNGDGADDFVVSAVGETVSGNLAAGAAYVIYGQAGANVASTFTSSTDLDALVTNGKAVKFTGSAAQDHFGSSVAMGDFNGDGLADIAVGAPGNSAGGTDAGQTTFVYGSAANLTQAMSVNSETLAAGTHTAGYAAIVGGVDRISGGLGDDTISGIGSASDTGNNGKFDVAYGAAGNDTIEIIGTNFTRVDGGLGNDTLTFTGSGINLDLAATGSKVQGFETFDIGGTGANTLSLTLADVLQQKDNASLSFTVLGGVDDSVALTNANGGTWAATGVSKTIDGHTFDVYHNSAMIAANTQGDVLIEQGIALIGQSAQANVF